MFQLWFMPLSHVLNFLEIEADYVFRLRNHKEKTGANMILTVPVPNLWTVNNSKRTRIETTTTESAKKDEERR